MIITKKLLFSAFSFVVVLSMMVSGVGVKAFAVDDLKKEFDTLYAKLDKALLSKDSKTILAYQTKDYTSKSKKGEVMNAKQSAENMEMAFSLFQKINSSVSKVEKVEAGEEHEAVVIVSQSFSGTINGPDNQPHEMNITAKSREIWVHEGDSWKIKYSEELEQKTLLDGKPIE